MPPPSLRPLMGCLVRGLMGPVDRTWNLSLTMCLSLRAGGEARVAKG